MKYDLRMLCIYYALPIRTLAQVSEYTADIRAVRIYTVYKVILLQSTVVCTGVLNNMDRGASGQFSEKKAERCYREY